MSTCTPDAYIGEIRMWAGNYAPVGWAFCNGTILPISDNNALFSLIGTIYGGDGRTTFGLPDLRGRAPMHYGTGPGLSPRPIGARAGQETVTLSLSQIPLHNHPMQGSTNSGTSSIAEGRVVAKPSTDTNLYVSAPDPAKLKQMSTLGIENTGGDEAHYNMQPYQTLSFIIALYGVYPNRN